VSGLTGPGLVLQDNASDNLSVPTNGNFVFPTHIASGATYDVTILSQPYAHCAVTSGGTGVVGTRITTVGPQNTITEFLPATYNFTNASITYHMTEFLGNGSQPAGAVVLGSTCTGANPNVLATRRYPSEGTYTYNALDIGNYTDANSQTNYVMPFLKGVLLYLRSPH
jgi:hypothetical protein